MKKRNLNWIALNESLNDANSSLYAQKYLMSLDITDFKIFKPPPPVKKKTRP